MLTLTRRFPRHYFSRLTCSPRSQLLRYDSLNLCSLNYVIGCGGSLRVPVGCGVFFTALRERPGYFPHGCVLYKLVFASAAGCSSWRFDHSSQQQLSRSAASTVSTTVLSIISILNGCRSESAHTHWLRNAHPVSLPHPCACLLIARKGLVD